MAAIAAANASTVTTNPGGTATPALASSPRDAPFPPTVLTPDPVAPDPVAPAPASVSVTTRATLSLLP